MYHISSGYCEEGRGCCYHQPWRMQTTCYQKRKFHSNPLLVCCKWWTQRCCEWQHWCSWWWWQTCCCRIRWWHFQVLQEHWRGRKRLYGITSWIKHQDEIHPHCRYGYLMRKTRLQRVVLIKWLLSMSVYITISKKNIHNFD